MLIRPFAHRGQFDEQPFHQLDWQVTRLCPSSIKNVIPVTVWHITRTVPSWSEASDDYIYIYIPPLKQHKTWISALVRKNPVRSSRDKHRHAVGLRATRSNHLFLMSVSNPILFIPHWGTVSVNMAWYFRRSVRQNRPPRLHCCRVLFLASRFLRRPSAPLVIHHLPHVQ